MRPSRAAVLLTASLAVALPVTAGCLPATGEAAPAPSGRVARAAGVPSEFGSAQRQFTLAGSAISESSGLAASRRHPGVLYTHNDSGHAPRVFALGPDGRTRAVLTLRGVRARDWEGIAVGPGPGGRPTIHVGDIGDNLGGKWRTITVYRFPEPGTLGDATVPAARIRLRYEDGPRDAEALLVHPVTGRLYVVSKKQRGAAIYQAPERLSTTGVNTLRRIAGINLQVTDGAFSPDGQRFVLRGYFNAKEYAPPARELGQVPIPLQRQGEGLTYTSDGNALLLSSEGVGSTVYRIPIEGAPVAEPAVSPAAAHQVTGGGNRSTGNAVVGGLALLGTVAVLLAVAWRSGGGGRRTG